MMDPKFEAPCRTTKCPREIPRLPWYRGVLPQMILAGLLPYSVICIELYYILASVWGHRIYMLFGVFCIVFILLIIITALVSVGLTYFHLAAKIINGGGGLSFVVVQPASMSMHIASSTTFRDQT